jgi:hypothetical protein
LQSCRGAHGLPHSLHSCSGLSGSADCPASSADFSLNHSGSWSSGGGNEIVGSALRCTGSSSSRGVSPSMLVICGWFGRWLRSQTSHSTSPPRTALSLPALAGSCGCGSPRPRVRPAWHLRAHSRSRASVPAVSDRGIPRNRHNRSSPAPCIFRRARGPPSFAHRPNLLVGEPAEDQLALDLLAPAVVLTIEVATVDVSW